MTNNLIAKSALLWIVQPKFSTVVRHANHCVDLFQVDELLDYIVMLGTINNGAGLVCFNIVDSELISASHALLDQVVGNFLPRQRPFTMNVNLSKKIYNSSSLEYDLLLTHSLPLCFLIAECNSTRAC